MEKIRQKSFTGLHWTYTDPDKLQKWLSELAPVQVQINAGPRIKRGEILSYTVGHEGETGYISVHFKWLCIGDYPQKKDGHIQWQEMEQPAYCTNASRKVRSEMQWVHSEQATLIHMPIRMEMVYESFYRTRDNRIKVWGTFTHWRKFQKKTENDFWRFFPTDDPTNIVRTGNTFEQKETII